MDKELLLTLNRPQRICIHCHTPLEYIERHPSALRFGKQKTLERFDYCKECWDNVKRQVFDSYWITRRTLRPRVRKLSRRERSLALRALFESLWERRETEDLNARLFFLAHLLMKWGGLRWKESFLSQEDKEIIIFENPLTGEALELSAPEIDDDLLSTIHNEIEGFLHQWASQWAIEKDEDIISEF